MFKSVIIILFLITTMFAGATVIIDKIESSTTSENFTISPDGKTITIINVSEPKVVNPVIIITPSIDRPMAIDKKHDTSEDYRQRSLRNSGRKSNYYSDKE